MTLLYLMLWLFIGLFAIELAIILKIYNEDTNEFHIAIASLFNKEKRQKWLQEGIKLKDVFMLLISFILAICALTTVISFFIVFFACKYAEKLGNVTIYKAKSKNKD